MQRPAGQGPSTAGQGKAPSSLLGKSLYVGNYYVTVQKKLGDGGFASVHQVVNRHAGKPNGASEKEQQQFFALKHFRINGDIEKLNSVKRECLLMNNIKKHPNVVSLYAACFAGSPVATDGFFLMELCHQDLVKALTANHRHMTETDILKIFLQVAQGINFMHSQSPPITHWDLKAENILQSLSGSWVVCDFGSANSIDEIPDRKRIPELEDLVSRNTTAAYRAPELYDLWSGSRVNTKVDIFALGVLLYLMCFSKFPFQADSKASVLRGNFPIPHTHHRAATCQLITRMLSIDPSTRPDISAVITATEAILEAPPAPRPAPAGPPKPTAAPSPHYPVAPGSTPAPQAAYNQPPQPYSPPRQQSPHYFQHHQPPQQYPQQQQQQPHPQPMHPQQHPQQHLQQQMHAQQQYPQQMPPYANQVHPTPQHLPPVQVAPNHAANKPPAHPAYSGQPLPPAQHQPSHAGPVAAHGGKYEHFDPFTAQVATGDSNVSPRVGRSAIAYQPFTAADPFSPGAPAAGAGTPALGGEPVHTSSAPVSPQGQSGPANGGPFGTGAHTAGEPPQHGAELITGQAAAATDAKLRVFPAAAQQSPLRPGAQQPPHNFSASGSKATGPKETDLQRIPVEPTSAMFESAPRAAAYVAVAEGAAVPASGAAAYAAASAVDGIDMGAPVENASATATAPNRADMSEQAVQTAGSLKDSSIEDMAWAALKAELQQANEDRDVLGMKLQAAMEELDKRRIQVGELRSIIEALNMGEKQTRPLSGTGQEDGDVQASPSGRTMKQFFHSGTGEIGHKVVAVLNRTAGWRPGGLRRSASDVQLDWSEVDKIAVPPT